MFLRPNEIALVERDYETCIVSPEATTVDMQFHVSYSNPDHIGDYGATPQLSTTPEVKADIPCLQQILKERDLKLLPLDVVEVGWCIFYFSSSLDFTEPLPGKVPVQETITFVDKSGTAWEPKLHRVSSKEKSLVFRLANDQVGQPVLCQPKT